MPSELILSTNKSCYQGYRMKRLYPRNLQRIDQNFSGKSIRTLKVSIPINDYLLDTLINITIKTSQP